MHYEPRAIVSESLDSKQSNMAFDWLMGLLKECYDPVELSNYQMEASLNYLVHEDLALDEGSIAWTMDPVTKRETIILGLGGDIQACYSKQVFFCQSQIIFAAPTAIDASCQLDYWSRYLVELSQFYQTNLQNAA